MPRVFHRTASGWAQEPICATRGVLSLAPVHFEPALHECELPPGGGLLICGKPEGHWILLHGRDRLLTHNGQRVPAGIRVLAHADALALDGQEAVYFSTEEAPRIELFEGMAKTMCPRCRSEVLRGQAAVKCPRCGVFHHELTDRACWSYAQTCAVCPQPTAFDSGLQWTPETL